MTATNAVLPLDVSTAQRLVRLLGMLGSAHDGEVANAGRMADRLIRERGLTWPQIIALAPTPPATFPPLSREPATALEWRQLAVWIKHNFADRLNAREHQFVTHMATWRSMPSPKQKEWLDAIAERVRGGRGMKAQAMDLRRVAHLLGGTVCGPNRILCPGPGHTAPTARR